MRNFVRYKHQFVKMALINTNLLFFSKFIDFSIYFFFSYVMIVKFGRPVVKKKIPKNTKQK